MAIRIVVTTCPAAALFTMPYRPIGAIGWMITMPMMIKFHSVSERFRRGPEFRVLSLLKPFSFLPRNYDATRRWPPALVDRILPAAVFNRFSADSVRNLASPRNRKTLLPARALSVPEVRRAPFCPALSYRW